MTVNIKGVEYEVEPIKLHPKQFAKLKKEGVIK